MPQKSVVTVTKKLNGKRSEEVKPSEQRISLEKKFELIREQICHEDELIHQRLSWLLVAQAFLFAALTAFITTDEPFNFWNPDIQTWFLPFGICVTGFLLNFFSFIGLRAAYQSLRSLRESWYKTEKEAGVDLSFYQSFPQITWVGHRGAQAIMTASGTPIVISAVWALMASAVTPNPDVIWSSLGVGLVSLIIMVIETWRN